MSLRDRLAEGGRKPEGPRQPVAHSGEATNALKQRMHHFVIDKLDMSLMAELDLQQMRVRLKPSIESIILKDAEVAQLSVDVRLNLIEALLDEVAGLGPLESLLRDPAVSDILINRADSIFVERFGKLEQVASKFNDNTHLLNIIQRIVSRVGRRVDESSPMVDARLADGSRVNAVVPPIAADGPILSIRRFGTKKMVGQDLVDRGVCTPDMLKYLRAAVAAKSNLLVSGGTGAGKTTLLNILSSFIPQEERIITIEDSAELSLQGHHVVRMEARPPNIEGRGEVSIRACVKNALRMRPDRVVIGEVRSAEVLDMLQAMNTGHEGSMATVHANTPSDAVDRLMMMLALSGVTLSTGSMAQFIARSVRVVVQVARFMDGKRRITHIAEVGDYTGEKVAVRSIWSWSPSAKQMTYHGGSTMQERFTDHGINIDLGSLT